MGYSICKNPGIRLDLMVEAKYYPQLVGYFQRMGCTYTEERRAEPGNGKQYAVLTDVQGKNGRAVGELIGLFYSLEWASLKDGTDDKFYILLNPRKKGKKKNVHKNRKETDAGSNAADRGSAADDSGSEPLGGLIGDGPYLGTAGYDCYLGVQGIQAAGHCNCE